MPKQAARWETCRRHVLQGTRACNGRAGSECRDARSASSSLIHGVPLYLRMVNQRRIPTLMSIFSCLSATTASSRDIKENTKSWGKSADRNHQKNPPEPPSSALAHWPFGPDIHLPIATRMGRPTSAAFLTRPFRTSPSPPTADAPCHFPYAVVTP
ncbi:hypothetical protein VTK56DRAFT_4127 [Thermocarpiscus australiensis]